MTEVVVTLKGAPLSGFGRTLQSASHATYTRQLEAAQGELARRVRVGRARSARCAGATTSSPTASRSSSLAPRSLRSRASRASTVSGRTSATTRLRAVGGPEQIGADKLWGPTFATAGNGMKIGIIDDGLDASNPYFNPSGFQYPPGFPKGQTKATTAEGDRAADVRSGVDDVQVREHAVRPDAARSTRRTSPGSPRATTARTQRERQSPASRRTHSSATTRRSRSRRRTSASTATAPRSPRRSRLRSPTG